MEVSWNGDTPQIDQNQPISVLKPMMTLGSHILRNIQMRGVEHQDLLIWKYECDVPFKYENLIINNRDICINPYQTILFPNLLTVFYDDIWWHRFQVLLLECLIAVACQNLKMYQLNRDLCRSNSRYHDPISIDSIVQYPRVSWSNHIFCRSTSYFCWYIPGRLCLLANQIPFLVVWMCILFVVGGAITILNNII